MLNTRYHGCRYMEFVIGGNKFLSLENELIKLTFWLNKGADLIEFRHKPKDLDLLWHSPMKMPDAGQYIAPIASESGAFFDYYPGGWQEVFPNSHSPTAEYKNAPLGVHGEVCLLPWNWRIIKDSEEEIIILLEVHTVRTPFRLRKTIVLRQQESSFLMDEMITNEGGEEMDYNWGHHPTFGAPFLEEGCQIELPPESIMVTPDYSYSTTARYAMDQRTLWPNVLDTNGNLVDAGRMASSSEGSSDSFHIELSAGWFALRNPTLALGVGMAWKLEDFPYLWCWQACGGNGGYPFYSRNYNLALEPFTNPIETLTESIENGNSRKLLPQESYRTQIWVGMIEGTTPVKDISLESGVIY